MGRGSSGLNRVGNEAYARANLDTQQEHQAVVDRLRDDSYGMGTYDITNLREVEYPNGYQVTFWQIGDNYSPQEYADRVNEFLRLSSDGRTSAGKFEGSPEISFHFNSMEEAIRLARRYNQISVWDWENGNEISTGGTGRRRR